MIPHILVHRDDKARNIGTTIRLYIILEATSWPQMRAHRSTGQPCSYLMNIAIVPAVGMNETRMIAKLFHQGIR